MNSKSLEITEREKYYSLEKHALFHIVIFIL